MSNLDRFVQERDAALLSLDEGKIRAFSKKYGAKLPPIPEIFWAGIHKARIEITTFPDEAKEISRQWLIEHGFRGLIQESEA